DVHERDDVGQLAADLGVEQHRPRVEAAAEREDLGATHLRLVAQLRPGARVGIARPRDRHATIVQSATLPNFFSASARAAASSWYSIQRVVSASDLNRAACVPRAGHVA